jgi:hypothetical protein
MKKISKIITIGALVALTFSLVVPIVSIQGYYREDFTVYRDKYIPIVHYRMYDPAGSDSYQKIKYSTSLSTSFEITAKGGGAEETVTNTLSVSMSSSIKTYDGSDSSKNGLGVGDVICGIEIPVTVRIKGYVMITTRGYYTRITDVDIVNVNWGGQGYFDVSPADYKATYGINAPNPKTSNPTGFSQLLSAGYEKDFTYKLKSSSAVSLKVGTSFDVYGIEIGLEGKTTISSSKTLQTTIHLEDDSDLIRHYLYFRSGYSSSGTTITPQSMIAWFDAAYPNVGGTIPVW